MTIPTNPSDVLRNAYVDNIVDAFNEATAEQHEAGRQWYRVAHDIASMIAPTVEQGAGVIAVLSARNSWDRNVKVATESFVKGKATGHTKANLDKAQRILDGESPETVLPMTLKTGHFYRCIVDPNDPNAVVIDRHAHDVAVGRRYKDGESRGLSSQRRYDVLVDAYRVAAKRLGASPSTVQATVWVAWVDKYRWKRS